MKTLSDVENTLKAFEKKFGLPVLGAQQQSATWFKTKLGVGSGSNASKIVAKRDSETRATYLASLVAQVCTGICDEFMSKECEWGRINEDAARSSYEFESGNEIIQAPFVFKDDTFRCGCSPDGFVGANRGVEIKCPYNTANFIKFITEDKIRPEYQWQVQFAMWVTGAEIWDFVQFDPRMKKSNIKVFPVERDEAKQKQLNECVPEFLQDMDWALAKIGINFGDQWKA